MSDPIAFSPAAVTARLTPDRVEEQANNSVKPIRGDEAAHEFAADASPEIDSGPTVWHGRVHDLLRLNHDHRVPEAIDQWINARRTDSRRP